MASLPAHGTADVIKLIIAKNRVMDILKIPILMFKAVLWQPVHVYTRLLKVI
jgi:hypothetical protein